jgi:hypothetical protein
MMAVFGAVAGLWLLPSASSAAELKGGLKIGFNLTDIHGADVRDFPYYDDPDTSWFLRSGFCGGGFITVNLSRTADLQAEAIITMKGSAQIWGFSLPIDTYSLRTTYLEIPLLIRLMARSSKARAFLLAGPAIGIKLSAVLKENGEPMTFNGFKSTDLGLVLGVGGIIRSRIIVELRYTMGLSKIIEQDGVPLDIKNTAFSLMAGYIF